MSEKPYAADAARLRSQLQRAGLSQVGAARDLHLNPRSIRMYLSGTRRIPITLTYALCWLEVRDHVAGELAEWQVRAGKDG